MGQEKEPGASTGSGWTPQRSSQPASNGQPASELQGALWPPRGPRARREANEKGAGKEIGIGMLKANNETRNQSSIKDAERKRNQMGALSSHKCCVGPEPGPFRFNVYGLGCVFVS